MKICQLLHTMTTGGAEILADRMGRHFAKQHDVVFACLDGVGEIGNNLRDDGFMLYELERGKGIDRGCVQRLKAFLRREGIDLVHAHQYTPFFYAAAARGLSGDPPIVFTEHGRFHPDFPSWKRGIFNRLMLRRSDRVIAVGNQVKQALVSHEWIGEQRIEVVYNGIHLEHFELNSERCPDTLRADLDLPSSAMVVIQVARLDPIKDHVTAVQAFGKVVELNTNLHLVIVGEGPTRDVIEKEIDRLGLSDHVHLLGLRRDVACLLRQADILLLTSVSEGIPLTLIEGMASELPCVATDVGGVSEVVRHRDTGLLVPAKNPGEIAEALNELAADRNLRESLGRSGKVAAESQFSEQTMLATYDQIFSSVVRI